MLKKSGKYNDGLALLIDSTAISLNTIELFRKEFSEDFGEVLFINAEIALKSFSPEIIPELQAESDLAQEYEKLLASAQIPFNGAMSRRPRSRRDPGTRWDMDRPWRGRR